MTGVAMELHLLNNTELVSKLGNLSKQERSYTVAIVKYLAELDRRGYYRDLGFSSLFAFCTEFLGYSEGAAQRRIVAARLGSKFSVIFTLLENGQISLTSLGIVSNSLTEENHVDVLAQCSGKSHADVQRIISSLLGHLQEARPAKRDTIRPRPALVKSQQVGLGSQSENRNDAVVLDQGKAFDTDANMPLITELEPQYSITFQCDQELKELIDQAKRLYGFPGIQMSELLKKLLKQKVQSKTSAKKIAATPKVKSTQPGNVRVPTKRPRRYIPKAVRQAVYERDSGRCTFEAADNLTGGRRCTCQIGLEYDHIKPFCHGGEHVVENLRLRCPAHNQLEAERVFGTNFMAQFGEVSP